MPSDLWSRHKEFAVHEAADEGVLNGSGAAALESNHECLSSAELKMMGSFDKQIDLEFRKLEIIEPVKERDQAWKDGLDLDHQMQVLEIKTLRDTMVGYAMEHSDNPILSDLVMQRVGYVDDTLDSRLRERYTT